MFGLDKKIVDGWFGFRDGVKFFVCEEGDKIVTMTVKLLSETIEIGFGERWSKCFHFVFCPFLVVWFCVLISVSFHRIP